MTIKLYAMNLEFSVHDNYAISFITNTVTMSTFTKKITDLANDQTMTAIMGMW